MKQLVVTADDFGLAREVNEAVEEAHRGGILTAASLMVGGAAAADAVRRAKAMPSLRVGLHLVLVEGRPMLPAAAIPDLVDANGNFRDDMARAGAAIFFQSNVRRQLEEEVEVQFEAFRATGLPLDHVNTHKHFHLHPRPWDRSSSGRAPDRQSGGGRFLRLRPVPPFAAQGPVSGAPVWYTGDGECNSREQLRGVRSVRPRSAGIVQRSRWQDPHPVDAGSTPAACSLRW